MASRNRRDLRLPDDGLAAALTAFYSWRLIFKTFHGQPHDSITTRPRTKPAEMLMPLGVLAAGSIFAGLPFKEFRGNGVEEFFRNRCKMSPHMLEDMEHMPAWIKLAADHHDGDRRFRGLRVLHPPALFAGELAADQAALPVPAQQMVLRRALRLMFVRPTKWLGRFLWKGGDGFVIDGFGPDGVSARVLDITRV